MAAYSPPTPPAPSANPLVDIERAFSFTAEFFTIRASVIRVIAQAVGGTINNSIKG